MSRRAKAISRPSRCGVGAGVEASGDRAVQVKFCVKPDSLPSTLRVPPDLGIE